MTAIRFVVIDSMTISSSNKISPHSVKCYDKVIQKQRFSIYSFFFRDIEMKRPVNQLPIIILVSTEVIGKFKN